MLIIGIGFYSDILYFSLVLSFMILESPLDYCMFLAGVASFQVFCTLYTRMLAEDVDFHSERIYHLPLDTEQYFMNLQVSLDFISSHTIFFFSTIPLIPTPQPFSKQGLR